MIKNISINPSVSLTELTQHMIFVGPNDEYFEVLDIQSDNQDQLLVTDRNALSLLWFGPGKHELIIDTQTYTPRENEFICLTQLHKIQAVNINSCKVLRFNRPFYCILDHDSEVGCKGLLYYGSSEVPCLLPNADELKTLEAVWTMMIEEVKHTDNLQLEMLQMMLKRLLILCTRIYKASAKHHVLAAEKSELVREYNFLVEQHYRTMHTVSEYAQLLHKSPKTISNTFKKLGTASPLQHIQNRIMLEAKRLLYYTNEPISEISDALGFNDLQAFSRFFKNKEQVSPQSFRKNAEKGKIDKLVGNSA